MIQHGFISTQPFTHINKCNCSIEEPGSKNRFFSKFPLHLLYQSISVIYRTLSTIALAGLAMWSFSLQGIVLMIDYLIGERLKNSPSPPPPLPLSLHQYRRPIQSISTSLPYPHSPLPLHLHRYRPTYRTP